MSDRATRLAEALPELGADLIAVSSLVNVRYLTGYTGSNGLALIGPDTRLFMTDFRYTEQAAAQVDGAFERQIFTQELLDALPGVLPAGPLTLAFEDAHVTVRAHAHLAEQLDDRITLVAAGDPVERLRAVKDRDEIQRVAEAARLADAALRSIIEQGLIGRTEREVALALEREMRALGADRPAFDSIVAAGPHGARPHAEPRDVEIAADQLVVIDWGAELDGYCSDCTRTLSTGEPGEPARVVYDIVREAQLAGLQAVTAGADGRETDAAARAVIDGAGHAEHYGHGLGHGVGLEIHEAPRLSRRSDSVLAAGNVVTVEPGIYVPGEFGVRIEDLVVVAESGGPEILTSIPKELITVG